MTEESRAIRALQAAVAAAQADALKQTSIMAYIGHDLRSPLATIVGYARLMHLDATPMQARHLQVIENEANRQLALIDELLEHSRGEMNLLGMTVADIDLLVLLDGVQRDATGIASRRHNRFVMCVSPECPRRVIIDGGRLHQVLMILLCNAGEFASDGVVALRVGACLEATNWRLRFEVSDTGSGDVTEDQQRQARNLLRPQPADGDLGLGLFIAQKIVIRMGGELRHSMDEKGCRFTFDVLVAGAADPSTPNDRRAGRDRAEPEAMPVEASASATPRVHDAQCVARPNDDSLQRLQLLASDGGWSDIEEWLNLTLAVQPECGMFVDKVRQALDALDFAAIARLASIHTV